MPKEVVRRMGGSKINLNCQGLREILWVVERRRGQKLEFKKKKNKGIVRGRRCKVVSAFVPIQTRLGIHRNLIVFISMLER